MIDISIVPGPTYKWGQHTTWMFLGDWVPTGRLNLNTHVIMTHDHKMGLLPWRKDFDHLNMVSHHRNMRISSEDVMQSNKGEHHHRAGAPVELQPQGKPFPNPVGIQGLWFPWGHPNRSQARWLDGLWNHGYPKGWTSSIVLFWGTPIAGEFISWIPEEFHGWWLGLPETWLGRKPQ